MTESEQFEIVGRKRFEYKNARKELAALRARAGEWSAFASKVSTGLEHPDRIRWWEGRPVVGQRPEHIVFTPQMFEHLNEKDVKQLCKDLERVQTVIASLRRELTELDEDPEPQGYEV